MHVHTVQSIPFIMLSNQVRSTFLDYFKRNGHEVVSSSSLIPYGDNTIMFTNAGMNQFKSLFLGAETRGYARAVTSQKVMRVSGKHNDLENVGPSQRHHTFFEMLGNFSFGDYFKDGAMHYALELLTKEYGLDQDRMWFSIYTDDDEAEALWIKNGVKRERILRFGEKENFWKMGDTGPCGPCSEIHYFVGDKKADNVATWVNNDDTPDGRERIVEIWNLVFMQYEQTADGTKTPLPKPSIDTGMGFERLLRVLNGTESNYETDLFADIMQRTRVLAHLPEDTISSRYIPYRVVADHARAAAMLIGDGVLPGNVGRNYILRMVMRRAMRFGRQQLGFEQPFLYQAADAVIDKMGDAYPELKTRRDHILATIKNEEERFDATLDQGLAQLETVLGASPNKTVNGEIAFKLYDTYGLPLEITKDVAKERGFAVDEAGFDVAREASKVVARQASSGKFEGNYDSVKVARETFETLKLDGKLTMLGMNHIPYGKLRVSTQVLALLRDGELTERAVAGETIDVVLADSPFYAEGGGQVGDLGTLDAANLPLARVIGVSKPMAGFVMHTCVIERDGLHVSQALFAQVDETRRAAIRRNHTATHLLQGALRHTLGEHVGQQGSLVTADRLRFDFSHPTALTAEQLAAVTDWVNAQIMTDADVWDRQQPYKEAVASGAMAFFSEKYGDVVRVVRIGDQESGSAFSAELCGGTHVRSTGEIGSAVVLSESAVASGVRRIEMLTGTGALHHAQTNARMLDAVAGTLGSTPDAVAAQVSKLKEDLSASNKALQTARRELAKYKFDETLTKTQTINGSAMLVAQVDATDADLLREMTDWFRNRHASGVAVLGAVIGDKPALVVAASADLNKRGIEAGKLIKPVAALVGGSGGGRPNLAQAGGKDASKLGEALAEARQLLAKALA